MKKVYDVKSVFEQHNQCYEICETCPHGQYYYESDTGYSEITCGGNYPKDCQETIAEYFEEEKENEIMENTNNNLMMEVDLNSFKQSIVDSIKSELRQEVKNELKNTLVSKVYKEEVEPLIEDIKNTMTNLVADLLKTEIETYYTESKILIGGGWNEESKEYTVKEYTQKMLKDAIEKGMFKESKSKYNDDMIEIEEYIMKNCITSEISQYMKNELKKVQKDVDKKVKDVFETQINNVMSEVALGVLKSNATYNEITKKLLG